MAVDMFLDLGDKIKGESKDTTHKGHIDILAWSWGLSQSSSNHLGAGGGSGKASFQDISITKYVDKASVKLMHLVATGDHILSGKLVVRKAGGKALEYIVIELKQIFVTSYSTGGSGGESMLTENITLSFAQIEVSYVPQKADGTGDPKVEFFFNIPENSTK